MIGLLWLFACGAPTPTPAPPRLPLAQIDWTVPTPATERVLVSLPAEIVLLPDGLTALGPPVESRVLSWRVTPGAQVTRGATLALLESPSLDGLRAAVDGQRRRRDAERERVVAGVGTRSDLAAADAALARDAATFANAGRMVRADDGVLHWTSPLDGVVAAIDCVQGVLVGPDRACVTIAAPERAAVLTHVPERHLAALNEVRGRFTSADGSRHAPTALLTRAPIADQSSRTLALQFTLPAGVALVPGSAGRIDLIVPIIDGWQLPEGAITTLDGEHVVFRRDGDAVSPLRVTLLGRGSTPSTRLIAGPLAAEDAIAARGVFSLKSAHLLGDSSD